MLVVTTTIGLAAVLGLIEAGEVLVDGNRARGAADAAALAGAEHGRDRAEAIAAANGAEIVGWAAVGTADGGRTVTVEVVVRDTSARARATTGP